MRLVRSRAAITCTSRALAFALCVAMAVATVLPATPARAAVTTWAVATALGPGDSMTPATRARELNKQGQQRFDSGDYAGAAGDWAQILEVLPENEVNRQERDNALLIALEGYRQAYEHRRVAPGDNSIREAVDYLRRAVIMLDTYAMKFERAYGKGAAISTDATQSGDEIRQLLAEAEKQLSPEPPPPDVEVRPDPPTFKPTSIDRGPSGTGLIVAGSVCIALGLGSMGMLIGGVVVRNRAERDFRRAENAMPPDERAQAEANALGANVANPLIITGAVLMGAFMVAGFTMLGIGIRRRVRYMAIAPSVGPRYVGVGLSAKF